MQARVWFVFILAFVLSRAEVVAQLSIRQFLQSAERDFALQSFDEQINYLNRKPYKLSMLNKLELRAQNNELGQNTSQRFGVRVSPSNPWEINNTNKYFKTYQESLSLEKEIVFKDALLTRYNLVIELLYLEQLKKLADTDKKIVDAQCAVLEKQQYSTYFDATDLAEVKLEQISKAIEVEELLFDINKQISKIDRCFNGDYIKNLTWEHESVISIERIEKVLDSLVGSTAASSELAYRDVKINLARRAYSLERSNFNLGFIQTQYTEGRTDVNRNPWGLSIGVNIPLTNPNKGDMAGKQLKVIEAEYERKGIETEMVRDKNAALERLRSELDRYRAAKARIRELDINAIANTLSTMKGYNPVITLKLNSKAIKLEVTLEKIRQDILVSYIEFLSVHDKLQQRPLVNYLSSTFDKSGD